MKIKWKSRTTEMRSGGPYCITTCSHFSGKLFFCEQPLKLFKNQLKYFHELDWKLKQRRCEWTEKKHGTRVNKAPKRRNRKKTKNWKNDRHTKAVWVQDAVRVPIFTPQHLTFFSLLLFVSLCCVYTNRRWIRLHRDFWHISISLRFSLVLVWM